jgi:predicted amidohydrolase
MRVTTIQARLNWEDAETNRAYFSEKIAGLSEGTDLVILPEMFSTGFSMNATALAETMDGTTLAWLRNEASKLGAAITGSFIVKDGAHYHNRLIWMQPDGQFFYYDKRHLFTFAGEDEHYDAGQRHLIVEWKGWKIMPLICYDLRFPVWSRNVQGYDLLIYVANWPEVRSYAWQSLLTARAIENQAYTIGVNVVGQDGKGISYSGDTVIHNYAGEVLYRVSHTEDVFTLELDKTAQAEFRAKFAFLNDRDGFELR